MLIKWTLILSRSMNGGGLRNRRIILLAFLLLFHYCVLQVFKVSWHIIILAFLSIISLLCLSGSLGELVCLGFSLVSIYIYNAL